MKILVLGASGNTGKLLVTQLLENRHEVSIIVRKAAQMPQSWSNHPRLGLIYGNITEMNPTEMAKLLQGCDAVASCLGHNMTLKGVFGSPRLLVSNAIKLLYEAALMLKSKEPIKLVLMNTAGYQNKHIEPKIMLAEKMVVGLVRLLVPPHRDNENAADFLRLKIGQENKILPWVIVRPDTLINEETISDYTAHTSPVRSPIFNPGKTSRINVAHFIAQLITDNQLWEKWQGQTPVIYND